MDTILAALDPKLIIVFLVLLIGDMALGAARAFKEHRFRAAYLANAVSQKGLPFGLSFIVLKALDISADGTAYADPATYAFAAAWTAVSIALLGSVAENVAALLGVPFNIPGVKST